MNNFPHLIIWFGLFQTSPNKRLYLTKYHWSSLQPLFFSVFQQCFLIVLLPRCPLTVLSHHSPLPHLSIKLVTIKDVPIIHYRPLFILFLKFVYQTSCKLWTWKVQYLKAEVILLLCPGRFILQGKHVPRWPETRWCINIMSRQKFIQRAKWTVMLLAVESSSISGSENKCRAGDMTSHQAWDVWAFGDRLIWSHANEILCITLPWPNVEGNILNTTCHSYS